MYIFFGNLAKKISRNVVFENGEFRGKTVKNVIFDTFEKNGLEMFKKHFWGNFQPSRNKI